MNTDSRKVREAYARWYDEMASAQTRLFNRYRIDNVDIATDSDYVKGLMALFKKR